MHYLVLVICMLRRLRVSEIRCFDGVGFLDVVGYFDCFGIGLVGIKLRVNERLLILGSSWSSENVPFIICVLRHCIGLV